MKRFKTHIVIILIGLIIFPIFFQSIHIVCHHNHIPIYSFCVHDDKEHCKSDDNNNFIKLISKNNCQICDYKFSFNNLPKSIYFKFDDFKIYNVFIVNYLNHVYSYFYLIKIPRAPPYFLNKLFCLSSLSLIY